MDSTSTWDPKFPMLCSAFTSTFFTTSRSVLSHTILGSRNMILFDQIFLWNKFFLYKRCQPEGYDRSNLKMGRVDETQSSSFLLLKKLYYPVGMKYRGTMCAAVERDASWCWYSASRAKSFVNKIKTIVAAWVNFKAETAVVHFLIPLDPVLFGVLHAVCLLVHDTLHEFCLVQYQHHRPVDVMVCKSNAKCHLFGDVVKLDAWFGAAFGHFKMSIDWIEILL